MLSAARGIIIKVGFLVFSFALTLFLLEVAIRYFYPMPINYYNFTVIQAEGGGEIVLGSDMKADRRPGYGPYKPNLSGRFGGVRVTINSHGWRDFEYAFERSPGVTRIMVVGDSVAFGYGVRIEETFPKVLERRLNLRGVGRHEVISLGGAGSNTYSQREIIKSNVPLYRPDLVILAFNLNDISLRRAGAKTKESADTSRLVWRAMLRFRRALDEQLRGHSHLYFIVRERIKIALRKQGIVSPEMMPLAAFDIESRSGLSALAETGEALLEISTYLRRENVKLLLAILPVDIQMSSEIAEVYRREYGFIFSDSLVHGRPQELLKEFAVKHGIAVLDLLPAFRKAPEEKKFFRIYGGSIDWNHPNSSGHRITAEELLKPLNGLISYR